LRIEENPNRAEGELGEAKSKIRNPQFQLNPNSAISINPQSEIRNPQFSLIRNPKSEIRNSL